MIFGNCNTFLLLSSDQPLRYRTYVRWGKDSDISILNYFSNPTKPISETYGLYQSYLKQSTGGPQEMVKISPYKADNLATKYTDLAWSIRASYNYRLFPHKSFITKFSYK